jgi:hypothetical protein
MASASHEEIAALLRETEAAHGMYETTELGGVYDEAWPRWYAQYAVDHGIGRLIGRDVSADELAGFLASSWDELSQADPQPAEHWTESLSIRIAEEL